MRNVPTFSGRSSPKCWPSGSSSLLKKRFTNASLTIGDRRGGFVVRRGERPPPQHRHPEVLKVVGAYAVPRRARLLVQLRRGMPGHQNQLAPVVGERVVQGEARSLHAGQAIQPILELAVQRGQFRLRVARRRSIQRHDDASLHLIAEVLMFELVQASRQHRRAGDEHDGQRRLHDEQRRPRERRMIAGAAARPAQRLDRIGARRKPRGRRTEDDARHQRQPEREREDKERWPRADGQELCIREGQREEEPRGAHGDQQARRCRRPPRAGRFRPAPA